MPRNVIPTHVAIDMKIDPEQDGFSGRVRVKVRVAAPARTFWMHGRDLTIESASITTASGRRQPLVASLADASGVLKLTASQPIAAGPALIAITYRAPYGKLQGAYRVRQNGVAYVMTQMESTGGRQAFPAFDEPGFKQPWDVTLTIPAALKGVANTRLLKETDVGGGWKKLAFATTDRLPSYLIAFAVGPWDIVEGPELAPNAVRRKPLRLRGIAVRGQGERMKYALENTGVIVAAQEAYFGIPYPYDKLDILAAPDFGWGGMENAGLIVYRDNLLFANDASPVRQRQAYWNVHSHEIAHQWFGDLVTMPWWDDVWLNEGFASWFGTKIVGQLQPGFKQSEATLERVFNAMANDSLKSTRRVREPISDFPEIRSAFDSITYTKGAAVLGMFERYLGPDRFRSGIRGYLRRHARGSATSADLIQAIAGVSDDPAGVTAAFRSFVDQPGVPMLDVGLTCDGPSPTLHIAQRRFLPVASSAPAAGQWVLPVCVRFGDVSAAREQCTLVREKTTTVALKTDRCPDWVMPNADAAGYYRFALAPADQARLESRFDALNEREQLSYADSVDAAFVSGTLDARAYLRSARRLATAAQPRTALAPVARLDWMVRYLAQTEAQKQGLRDQVAAMYGPRLAELGLSPRPGETDEVRLFRSGLMSALAYTAREPALRADLARKGRLVLGLSADRPSAPGDGQLRADAVPADQRRLALGIAMEDADAADFDTLRRHLVEARDPELRNQLIAAASDMEDPALLARAREMVLATGVLRRSEYEGLFPKQRDGPQTVQSGRAWIDANFDAIAGAIAPFGANLVSHYASGMCSPEEARTLTAKFADRLRTLEGGPRTLAKVVESVQMCAALATRQRTETLGAIR